MGDEWRWAKAGERVNGELSTIVSTLKIFFKKIIINLKKKQSTVPGRFSLA